LTYSGWLTHISGHPSATSRAQDSERTPAKDRCSTAGPHNTAFSRTHHSALTLTLLTPHNPNYCIPKFKQLFSGIFFSKFRDYPPITFFWFYKQIITKKQTNEPQSEHYRSACDEGNELSTVSLTDALLHLVTSNEETWHIGRMTTMVTSQPVTVHCC